MKTTEMILVFGVIGLRASIASTVDVAGRWRAEFDTQISVQKYLFTFQTDGNKLTGKAAVEVGDQKREAEFAEGKITSRRRFCADCFQPFHILSPAEIISF